MVKFITSISQLFYKSLIANLLKFWSVLSIETSVFGFRCSGVPGQRHIDYSLSCLWCPVVWVPLWSHNLWRMQGWFVESRLRNKSSCVPPIFSYLSKCTTILLLVGIVYRYSKVGFLHGNTWFVLQGFFRRTISERDNQRYTCRNGGTCLVTLATRNNCKSCRYRKCLSVGMSKDGKRGFEKWGLVETALERFSIAIFISQFDLE